MNNANTSSQNPVTKKGENLTSLLVVAVAVLGTLVAVALLASGLWACVVCGKTLYRRRRCHKRREFGIERFPSHPREMVELGHIPHLSYSPRHNVNNTGISRSLGLSTSCPAEQLPKVPLPRSWTPSPPFATGFDHAPRAVTDCSRFLQENRSARQVKNKTAGRNSPKWEGDRDIFCDHQSFYHPGYNTLASDVWSLHPAYPSSSSHHTSRPYLRSSDEANRRTPKESCHGKRHQTTWRNSKEYDKEPDNCTRSRRKEHTLMDCHHSSQCSWRSSLEEDTVPPDACSSYRGSPESRHSLGRHSPYQQQTCHFEAGASHSLDSFHKPVRHELSKSVHRRKPDSCFTHRRNLLSEISQRTEEEELDEALIYQRTDPLPTRNLTPTKPRRLWRESCGFRNEVLPSEPCWVRHLQTPRRRHTEVEPPLFPPQQPRPDPHNVDEACEREVFRRIARKYGFCETCGLEKSLKKRHETARDKVRGGHECCASSPDDPTPSMSWDNLTPEPSPALADTQLPQVTEEAATSTQTEDAINGRDADGDLALSRENTYVISGDSAADG